MISKYSHKELTWIDLESPKEEEINYILEEYSIPSYIKEKIENRGNNDEISIDYDYLFTSIDFPQNKTTQNSKLFFIVNDSFIISIHNERITSLSSFIKEIELNINSSQKLDISNNKVLFAHLLKNLFIGSQKELLLSNIKAENLKQQILKNNKKLKLLTTLSFVSLGAIMLISIYVFSHI
ncbi:MAG: CorA family divalent cation transporter [Candidatus Paceibacterota bacterium]